MINFSLLDEAYPNDDKLIASKKKKKTITDDKDTCKPLQAPPYIIPNACDITSNYVKNMDIMEKSMKQNDIKKDFKKDGIRAYDYDEMDAYLAVSDIKTNNTDKTEEYRTTPFLANYLRSLRNNFNKPISQSTDIFPNIEQFSNFSNSTNIKIDVNLYNLFLFIFLGIVIIILIDQITKLVSLHP